uniref:Granulins domain-containing protein n=1 Tax=Amazona collaria TaxID=241587 RepID=A0A8B9FCY4_9PSIT
MRTLLLLWLVLSGAGAWCHDGQPCPSIPVSAEGEGGPGVSHQWVTPLCIPLSPGPFPPSLCHSRGAFPPHPPSSPQGVPCANGHRCCPRGSRCSTDGESCITPPGMGGSHVAPRAVPCPDGQSECPDDATCCVTASGAWGCCLVLCRQGSLLSPCHHLRPAPTPRVR